MACLPLSDAFDQGLPVLRVGGRTLFESTEVVYEAGGPLPFTG